MTQKNVNSVGGFQPKTDLMSLIKFMHIMSYAELGQVEAKLYAAKLYFHNLTQLK